MASVIKLLHDIDGNTVYPKTLASAITYKDGTATVEGMLSECVYADEDVMTVDDVDPVNANTLDGHPSNYFAKNTDLNSLSEQYKNTALSQSAELRVLDERMSTFTNLPNGSTSGDAELQDIRVKVDGTSAASAGAAVREQISDLKSSLDKVDTTLTTAEEAVRVANESKSLAEEAATRAEAAAKRAEGLVPTDGKVTSVNGKGGIVELTADDVGAAPKVHIHNSEDIIGLPTSLKNPTSLIVKFNGTDAATYDGSAQKTLNITPSGIGAAPVSHKHPTSDITNFPSALKNPTSLVIKNNGVTVAEYDGSEAKEVNIVSTADDVGAMPKTGGTFTGPVYFGSETYYINTAGEANFSKAYGAYFNDYAELFPKGEETRPGEILALDTTSMTERYVKATETSTRVVGVHSDEFAMLIGGEKPVDDKQDLLTANAKKYVPVALMGRVKTYVYGIVHTGDYIVPSDIPGVGRAVKPDESVNYSRIVGYAVESDDRTDIRRLRVRMRG